MRAKTVPQRKAYVWDFDDTLVKTSAKVHIYKDGRRIKSLTPEEYNFYKPSPGETTNMDDFIDPRIIMQAQKYKMWPALKNIDMAKKSGRSDSEIYILTARSPKAQLPIYNFLKREGIDVPLENVITLGNDGGEYYDIAGEKKKVLSAFVSQYSKVLFFDDSEKNIELANQVPGIKSRLVDSMNENFQRAKKVLADQGKDTSDQEFQKLKKLLEKSPGFMGKFTEWMYNGTPYWKLSNTYRNDYLKAKKKGIKLDNIDSFNSFEEFKQNLDNAVENQWKHKFAAGIPKEITSLFNDEIWKLLMTHDDKMGYIKKFLKTWGRRYKSSEELYSIIESEILTYRDIKRSEAIEFFSSFDDSDAEILYTDEKNILVDIKTHKALQSAQENHYISRSYCFGEEEVWCNLISADNVQQYFWINFEYDFRDPEFITTFTLEDGEITRIGNGEGEILDSEWMEELKVEIEKKFSKILKDED